MTSRDFCFWLQGFFEINGKVEGLSQQQIDMIRLHLDYVFKHEIAPPQDKEIKTPKTPTQAQGVLQGMTIEEYTKAMQKYQQLAGQQSGQTGGLVDPGLFIC